MIRKIEIYVESDEMSVFHGLFAYGFTIDAQTGISLFDLLCRQAGISETYLTDRVQTIFLNNKAVDDIYSEIVKDESVIALSAAMPGLVGAVFRKGGILSSMRSGINNQPSQKVVTSINGRVTLKFFNMIASDLGPGFLKKGILLKGDHFNRYVNWKRSQLELVCRIVSIDGQEYDIKEALGVCRHDKEVFLSVNPA